MYPWKNLDQAAVLGYTSATQQLFYKVPAKFHFKEPHHAVSITLPQNLDDPTLP